MKLTMVAKPIAILTVVAAASLLSGCSKYANALHTATVYDHIKDGDVIHGPTTDPTAVDMRTGKATYTGLGAVAASDGTNGTLFLGDTTMVINFDTNKVSGQIDMYSAKDGFDPNVSADTYLSQIKADPKSFILSMGATTGTVTFTNGFVAGGNFTVDATSGALMYNGATVLVNGGTVTGEFTGDTANGIRSTTSDLIGTINGMTADQLLIYFAGAE